MNIERWIPAKGFKPYEVSTFGRIRRLSHGSYRVLKSHLNNSGYPHVGLYIDGQRIMIPVHQIVADSFIGKLEVNHIDGDKHNNCIENLEYVTRSMNIRHAIKLNRFRVGSKNRMAKLNEAQVLDILKRLKTGIPMHKIAKQFGVCQATISFIHLGDTWKHIPRS